MSSNVILQLADGEGLMSVVIFSGLSHPMIVRPAVYGNPVLTAQPFYYLEELGAVAQIRFEDGQKELSIEDAEYLVDNYLYEFSKRHPDSRISFKVSCEKFWQDDPREFYIGVDQNHTFSLALDAGNDPNVLHIEPVDADDHIDLTDWNVGVNYVMGSFAPYLDSLSTLLSKRIKTLVRPSRDRDGYYGRLRVLKPGHGLIDFWQAASLERISLRSISDTDTTVPLAKSACAEALESLPIERIETHHECAPVLLSHYFSGLKEVNPLKAFVGFYNVLEYYFEIAPTLVGRTATNELNQLHCVIEMLITDADVMSCIASIPAIAWPIVHADLPTSSGVPIRAFNSAATSPRAELARWLYDIRCSIVHSKKTRRGHPVPSFEPYTASSKELRHVIPLLRWLAIACIEKDVAQRKTNP